jgi:ketosteroid isomerase-like protein
MPVDQTESAALTTVRAALKAYATGDFDGFLKLLADRVEYTLYLDESVVPFAGTAEGKFDFVTRLADMHRKFEYILFRPTAPREQEDGFHAGVEFIYRHRATGEHLEGRFRLIIEVANGLVHRIREIHDAERIKAFFRVVESGNAP